MRLLQSSRVPLGFSKRTSSLIAIFPSSMIMASHNSLGVIGIMADDTQKSICLAVSASSEGILDKMP